MKTQEYKIKGWVARDESGDLYFYYCNKPFFENGEWNNDGINTILDSRMFPNLSFDDEPIEVEFTIKKI